MHQHPDRPIFHVLRREQALNSVTLGQSKEFSAFVASYMSIKKLLYTFLSFSLFYLWVSGWALVGGSLESLSTMPALANSTTVARVEH
jgi:hypothetical protein